MEKQAELERNLEKQKREFETKKWTTLAANIEKLTGEKYPTEFLQKQFKELNTNGGAGARIESFDEELDGFNRGTVKSEVKDEEIDGPAVKEEVEMEQ